MTAALGVEQSDLKRAAELLRRYASVVRDCHSSELERFDYIPEIEDCAETVERAAALASHPGAPVQVGSVAWLIQQLQELPQDKAVICQVVGMDGGAWNMQFEFAPLKSDWAVHLRVSHPDLRTLPPFASPTSPPAQEGKP